MIIWWSGNMKVWNKIGPKIDPWGTPHGKAAASDTNSPIETEMIIICLTWLIFVRFEQFILKG